MNPVVLELLRQGAVGAGTGGGVATSRSKNARLPNRYEIASAAGDFATNARKAMLLGMMPSIALLSAMRRDEGKEKKPSIGDEVEENIAERQQPYRDAEKTRSNRRRGARARLGDSTIKFAGLPPSTPEEQEAESEMQKKWDAYRERVWVGGITGNPPPPRLPDEDGRDEDEEEIRDIDIDEGEPIKQFDYTDETQWYGRQPEFKNDPYYNRLTKQIQDIRAERDAVRQQFGPEMNPAYDRLGEKMMQLENRMDIYKNGPHGYWKMGWKAYERAQTRLNQVRNSLQQTPRGSTVWRQLQNEYSELAKEVRGYKQALSISKSLRSKVSLGAEKYKVLDKFFKARAQEQARVDAQQRAQEGTTPWHWRGKF